MVRRLIAASLAAALVVVSPGPDAVAAVAGSKVVAPVAPVSGVSGAVVAPLNAAGLGAVSLTAPSAAPLSAVLPSVPALAPASAVRPAPAAADAPRPAASVPALADALAPALQSVAEGRAGAAADHGSARHIEDVITGGRSSAGAGDASVAGSFSAGAAALSAPADAPAAAKAAPEAPKTAPVKVVASRLAYAWHRFALSAVASLTGAVHSMPAAGPALVDRAVARAADKRVVISDFDDTLAAYNQTLSPEMIDAVRQVKAAGKHFAVISDRGDEKRAHQLTVFESLETLPVEVRAGMYVAANSGGRVYRYDEKGEPVRLYETPPLADERKALVEKAAAATKARLSELGAEQHFPSEKNNNPSESWNTYGYAMMLKVGSNDVQVRGAAAILQEELAKAGIEAEVKPRFAKDPANPPYINFSIVTKQPATAFIAKALGASAKDVVLVGDSMYDPREAKKPGSWLDRMGAKLAGRAMPKTGNATDRNMEKALPGALTFAVGHNADPRMTDAWVTGQKGPESTRRMLLSVASKPAAAPEKSDDAADALSVVALVGLLAMGATGLYFVVSSIAEILVLGEQLLRQQMLEPYMMLGGAGLVAGSLKSAKPQGEKKKDEDKPMTRGEKVGTGLLLAVAGAGALAMWYLLYAGFGNLPATPVEVPEGWQGPLPNIRGWEDLFGMAGLGMAGMLAGFGLKDPADRVSAEERAHIADLSAIPGVERVKGRRGWAALAGVGFSTDDRVLDVEFKDLASLEAARAAGRLPAELPSSVTRVDAYHLVARLSSEGQARETARLDAEHAAVYAAIPGVVSVGFVDATSAHYQDFREVRPRFRDEASLRAAREAGRLARLPELEPAAGFAPYFLRAEVETSWQRRWRAFASSPFGAFAGWLLLVGLTAAIYGGFYWAASHAPAATPSVPVAPGGWESLFQGLGLAGAGVVGWSLRASPAPAPGDAYASAQRAVERNAVERGIDPSQALFLSASLPMTSRDAAKLWSYTFALPRGGEVYDRVSVAVSRLGGAVSVSVWPVENSRLLAGEVARALPPEALARGAVVAPDEALARAREAAPGLGSTVDATLAVDEASGRLTYRFYDLSRAEVHVDAARGEPRVVVAPAASRLRPVLLGAALAVVAVAVGFLLLL